MTAWYGDGSNYLYNETGFRYDYQHYRFWGAVGARYTEPFSHKLIEFSFPDQKSVHLLYGASIRFSKSYEVAIEGTLGGAPLGEEDDYTTYLHFKYYFGS